MLIRATAPSIPVPTNIPTPINPTAFAPKTTATGTPIMPMIDWPTATGLKRICLNKKLNPVVFSLKTSACIAASFFVNDLVAMNVVMPVTAKNRLATRPTAHIDPANTGTNDINTKTAAKTGMESRMPRLSIPLSAILCSTLDVIKK